MKTETIKYKLVFLPEIEFDVLRSLIPADNICDYEPLTKVGTSNFMLKDSLVVFVSETYRATLHMKAKTGNAL